jgi:DNA-binding GntR family transcriptional regulator
LRLLGQQGLMEHPPRRGVRVTQLSARDIDELFTLRDALEQFAVRCAAARPRTTRGTSAPVEAVDVSAWGSWPAYLKAVEAGAASG